MDKTNKSNKIIYCVFIIIILGLVFYICYDKGLFNNKSNTNTKGNITDKKKAAVKNTKKEDNTISDEVKNDISVKVSEILSQGTLDTQNDSLSYSSMPGYFGDKNKTYIENMETNDAKLYTVLLSYNRYGDSSYKEVTQAEYAALPSKFDNFDIRRLKKIDASIIEQKYEKMFGEKPQNMDVRGCPGFYYDKDKALYYTYSECGGTHYPAILAHKDSYTKIDNKIEVVISMATLMFGDAATGTDKVYKGATMYESSDMSINQDNFLYEINSNNYYDSAKMEFNFKDEIENNYDKYAKYKMTFKKTETGNYVYESLKKM